MKCPKCAGDVRVRYATYTEENETYRRKQCVSCGHVFYTMEFEIENTPAFQKEWSELVKTAEPAWQKKRKKIYTLYLRANGEIIASGTADECAKQMNMSNTAFRSMVSRVNRGIIKRYEAEIRDCKEEELEEE